VVVDELAWADVGTLSVTTEKEAVNLAADAPLAMRHVTLELNEGVVPAIEDPATAQSAIFAVAGTDDGMTKVRIWSDDRGAGARELQPGTELPLDCRPLAPCHVGFWIAFEWAGRTPFDVGFATWEFSAVVRYPDGEPSPDASMIATIDRRIDASHDAPRVAVERSGTLERAPGDGPVDVPTEPGEQPTFVVNLATWRPISGADRMAVPATGSITLSARSADGSELAGPVSVRVVTHTAALNWSYPAEWELTPALPVQTLAVLPSQGCGRSDAMPGGDRCALPVEIVVKTPDAATGPVIVEWTVNVQAIEAGSHSPSSNDVGIEGGR